MTHIALAPEIAAAAARGWKLLPVEPHGKKPLVKEWQKIATSDVSQLQAWTQMYSDCNWGVATGEASGLVVIDIDGKEGRAALADLESQGLVLTPTLTVTTGRTDGGEHCYYRMQNGVSIRNDQAGKIGKHIDVRATGGLVVFPPSVHASGSHYRFVDADASVAELPVWIVERLTSSPSMSARPTGPEAMDRGKRTKRMVSLAGTLQKTGASPAAIEAALLAENSARCDPPLPKGKVVSIARDIPKRYPASEPSAVVVAALPPMTREEASRITAALLDQCRVWIHSYIVLFDEQATIMAAWILHTYAFNAAETTPYIHITAPEKESGKSRLMEALAAIAAAPVCSEGMTAAALVRIIAAKRPTLFLDEMDAQLGGDKERVQDIRGILNAGFRKGGVFYKCAANTFELQEFSVYNPKCFGGIGQLPDTVSSRSIVIEMHRKLPGEVVESFRLKAVKIAATPIKEELEQWALKGAADLLSRIEPTPIPSLSDRQNDIAEPLLAIAQLAGEEWLQGLTKALKKVFSDRSKEDSSIGVTLLADIRAVFNDVKTDRIRSKVLAERLCEIEGHPWAEWSRGKGLSANNLARQLKKFKLYPDKIRFGKETAQGYERRQFEDCWSRYCPCPAKPSGTTEHPASSLNENEFSNRNTHCSVPDEKSNSNQHEHRSVPVVPVANREEKETEVRI